MPIGFDEATADAILDAVVNGVDYPGNATVFLQLHTAGAGPAGTSHVAATAPRKALTGGTPTGGQLANTNTITWTGGQVATETVTNWSLWDSLSGGTFILSGSIDTPISLVAGTAFTLNPGDVTFNLNDAG